ncbi:MULTISPECIES: LexA family transcriptional regulator [Vibrio]|uniref:LexA family transcriptional regulator n=1 Tax=Vibrio TaxID=662 RepID=UPI0016809812|nr:S24 family peptidase [Vibrio sp. S17_S38]MBD1574806.1 hypothetical protein [Vibrio sp. S17_S38]
MAYKESDQVAKITKNDPFVEDGKGSIKERIRALLKGRTTREAAKDWDIPLSTLGTYLSRGTMPSVDKAFNIANKEGVSLEWLVTGNNNQPNLTPINKDVVEILQYDFKASAGAGCLVVSENPVAKFEFSKEWLVKQSLYGKHLTIVPVFGDSMEPTLMDEDLMLVEVIEDPKQLNDGIYVFRIDDSILVKRLQFDFAMRGYHATSDNSAYKPFFIGEEFEGRFQILGRMARVLQRAKR